MKHGTQGDLKISYYRSFLALIVIPILVIMVISMGIINAMMRDSAVQNIRRTQDNVLSTLNSEVKDISLRLSHLVYINDSEIMETASKTSTDNAAERYHYTEILTQSFNYAMVPLQDILSAVFFMKDGDVTYLKDDIVLPRKEVEASEWYQEALAEKNVVKVGFYNTNVTYSRQNANTFTIVAGLSPGGGLDREGNIDMAALFISSRVGNMMKDYNKENILGSMMILDRNGQVIFDNKGAAGLLPDEELAPGGVHHYKIGRKQYVCVVSEEPMTQSKIVSIIEAQALTKTFNRTAFLILGVMILLFALYYCFSSYFLKSIAEPVHSVVIGMEKVEKGNLDIHVEPSGQAEIRIMVHSFNNMVRRLKNLIEENEIQQQKKHEAEIQALQSQINPHFLVNSLNSIRFMAQVSKFEGIRKMAEALIKILSTSFRSNASFHTVDEELEVLDGFVYLMKIRYSDGFDVRYEVEDSCRKCLIPRLILQPVVENSIVHGFSDLVEEIGMIEIRVKRDGDAVVFTIRDNGKGIREEDIRDILSGKVLNTEEHNSIGVINVVYRLKLNYGDDCGISMESRLDCYTETTMRIPAVMAKERDSSDDTGDGENSDEKNIDCRR